MNNIIGFISRIKKDSFMVVAIVLFILFLILIFSVIKGNDISFKDREISFITGSDKGVYYSAGQAVCRILKRESNANNCKVVQSSGSEENATNIRSQKVYGGIVRADVFYKNKNNLQQIGSLHSENLMVLIRKDENIKSLNDLEGKKIFVGDKKSNTYKVSDTILKEVGIRDNVIIDPVEEGEDANGRFGRLCSGEVSAVFYFVGYPSNEIQDALDSCSNSITILSLTESVTNKIISKRPYYQQSIIPQDVYDGITKDIKTIGLSAILSVSNEVEKRELKYLQEVIVKNIADIQKTRLSLESVNEESFQKMLISDNKKNEES